MVLGFVKLVLDHGTAENSGNETDPQLHILGLVNKIFGKERSSLRYQSRNLFMGTYYKVETTCRSQKRRITGLLNADQYKVFKLYNLYRMNDLSIQDMFLFYIDTVYSNVSFWSLL